MVFRPRTSRFPLRLTVALIATLAAIGLSALPGHAIASTAPIPYLAAFNSATDVPVTASSFTATGNTVNFTLNFAPPTGTALTVVNNTGLDFINGVFSNLAQGQAVDLSFGGTTYHFVANYYGGTGNDLVLLWAYTRLLGWGFDYRSVLGTESTLTSLYPALALTDGGNLFVSRVPVPVSTAGLLSGKTITATAAGNSHSLALCSDGTLASWGDNFYGQLGTLTSYDRQVPAQVNMTGALAGKTVIAVAAGWAHNLVLCSDGTLAAWGLNDHGQLGNNSRTNSPFAVAVNQAGVLAGKTVVAIAVGNSHDMVLCADGTVVAWGWNTNGELGNNSTTDSLVPVLVNTSGVLAGKTATAIAAGNSHSLALCSDGTLASWGCNTYGQLGNNSTVDSQVPVNVALSGVLAGKTIVAIATGDAHCLALCSDGTLAAWGSNTSGQLGKNGPFPSQVPELADMSGVPVGKTVTAVTGGYSYSCSQIPVLVDMSGVLAGKTVTAVTAGNSCSFALCSDGSLTAWGADDYGSLGDGGTTNHLTPVNVNTRALPAGSRLLSCTAGAVSVANFALLAVDAPLAATFNTVTDVPVTASSYTASGFVDFTLNFAPAIGATLTVVNNTGLDFIHGTFAYLEQGQAVALVYDGVTYNFVANYFGGTGNDLVLLWAYAEAVAWGSNINGGLSSDGGPVAPSPVPVNATGVLAGKTVIALATGQNHSLAACSDGTLAAWGNNSLGQLGNGSITNSVVPVAVDRSGVLAGKTVIALAANVYCSLALCSDGTVAAWGDNNLGQLGNTSTKGSNVPVLVDTTGVLAGKTVVAIAAGGSVCLALCSDGTVAAWGAGFTGTNPVTRGLLPQAVDTSGVLAGKTVISIAAGAQHSLALCSDGTVAAWGNNYSGQLGNGTGTTFRALWPVAVDSSSVLSGKTIISVAAGGDSSLALCADGTLAAWGMNLGNGSGDRSSVPVHVDQSGVLVGRKVVAVAAGFQHMLALCADGSLAAWGDNTSDELGIDNTTGNPTSSPVPMLVSTTGRFLLATSGSASLHSLGVMPFSALQFPSPRLAVVLAAGTNLISNDPNALDFGTLPRGSKMSKILSLNNTGIALLQISSATLSGPGRASFSIARAPATSVPPGSGTPLIVTYIGSPSRASAVLHIRSNDLTAPQFKVNLTGNWIDLPPGPGISAGPASSMTGLGQPALLLADASGTNGKFQWFKDNVALPGATKNSYNIAPATLAEAGTYVLRTFNAVGGQLSSPANLGVVNVAPSAVPLAIGGTLTLTTAAAGPGLTYQWSKAGYPLADCTNWGIYQSTISGSTTPTLSITNASAVAAGAYTCLVTMPNAPLADTYLSLSSGVFTVTLSTRAVLDAFTPGPWIVSGAVTDVVTAHNNPTSFSITGLPAGVTFNTTTGQLGGAPSTAVSAPTTYHLTLSASNAFGAGPTLKRDVVVLPLPANAIGSFSGLLDRDAVLTSGYGGTLSMLSLGNGIFTGKVMLGAISYSFAARLNATISLTSATVVIPRSPPLNNLTLAFSINSGTGELAGTLSDGAAPAINVLAWRNPCNAISNPAPLAATYNSALVLNPGLAGNLAYPQGSGFSTLIITSFGASVWIGRMADGAIYTSVTTLGPAGQVPLHSMLYANTGSVHGWVTASAPAGPRLLDGSVDWLKSPAIAATDRTYHAGIPLNTLTVTGGEYVPPASHAPVLGLTNATDNATLTFSSANIESSVTYLNAAGGGPSASLDGKIFTITASNAVVLPAGTGNPAALALMLNPATGIFIGIFMLKGDPDPTHPGTLLSRIVGFNGLLVTGERVNQGVGYFLVPQLPAIDAPDTTLITSPILSGKVVLQRAP